MHNQTAMPHCQSYYAASRNDHSDYPRLIGSRSADVCIVGGGFTGVASALSLAERGAKVILLEQHRIGWGASGRNGGQLINGISGEQKLLRRLGEQALQAIVAMGFRGHEVIESRIKRYQIDCDLRYGFVEAALKPRQLQGLEDYFTLLQRFGYADQATMLDQQQLRELLATTLYCGGLRNDRNGHLHPLNLCLGEARAAAGLGVDIFEGSEVLRLQQGQGQRHRIITAQGEVTADQLILAGNAYSKLVQPRLPVQIFPASSFIIATEPLSEIEVAALNPHNLAVADCNHVLDYYRLSADRRLLFGGRCNYSGRTPKNIAADMRPRLLATFPQLADKRIDFAWGGDIAIVLNRVPLLGQTADNIYYAMGYCGHGLNVSHIAAELIADAIDGKPEKLHWFAQVPHYKIPLGSYFSRQILALGMLYYRLLDKW